MYNFKIKEIYVNDGSKIIPKRINIIVGPNNSGKSRFLKDIRYLLNSNNDIYNMTKNIVIDKMRYELPKKREDLVERYIYDNKITIINNSKYIMDYNGLGSDLSLTNTVSNILDRNCLTLYEGWEKTLDYMIENFYKMNEDELIINETEVNNFINTFGSLFYYYLGNEEKLIICKKQTYHGIENNSFNFLSKVRNNNEALNKLSYYTKKLFNKDIYLDKTSFSGKLAFRIGDDFDFIRNSLRDDIEAESKLIKYPLLDDEGDGIKNFVSVFLSMVNRDKNIILIDEPEAFLHPPIARRFGEIIPSLIAENQQLFLVTHSEDILNGIISTLNNLNDLNIIRIKRNKDINDICILEDGVKKVIKRKAIISASNILKGLFCDVVYITESYTDSIIYQKLLSRIKEPSEFYFVNTQGKHVIKNILSLYDNFKIKNFAIYDFDFFREAKTVSEILKIKNISDEDSKKIRDAANSFRSNIKKIIEEDLSKSGVDKKKISRKKYQELYNKRGDYYYHEKGIYSLKEKTNIKKAIDLLYNYGIIVISTGCLETVFTEVGLNFSLEKSEWYESAFDFIDKLDNNKLKKIELVKLFLEQ